MQPICSVRTIPRLRLWSLGVSHAIAVASALLAAVALRLGWRDGLDFLADYRVVVSVWWGIFLVAVWAAGFYDADRSKGLGKTLATAIAAVAGGTFLAAALLRATSPWNPGWSVLLLFAVFALLAVLAMRLVQLLVRRLGLTTSRCLVIGTNGDARRAIDLVHRHPHAGLQIVGMVHCGAEPTPVGSMVERYPVLGSDASLKRLIRVHRIDKLIVAAPSEVGATLLRRLRSSRYRGVAIADYGSLHEDLTQEISVEHINDEWLLAASMNSSRPHSRRSKRILDLVASLGALALAVPLTAVTVVLVKLDSKGPVLYRQERLGRDGVAFTILKFRTMTADAESRTGPVWCGVDDPRITRVGRWLRRFRVDEVPQLINVLRGEMSLIGPRPERQAFVTQLAEQIPFYRERFMVQPGITGWAQVMQPYAASVEESRRKLQADLYYIKHMSLLTDMDIILKTLSVVLSGGGRVRSVVGMGAVGPAVGDSPL